MPTDPDFAELHTARLVIRRFRPEDAIAFALYRSDPNVARYQSWNACTPEQADAFVSEMAASRPGTPGEWFQFAAADPETDELLGDVALCVDADDPSRIALGLVSAAAHPGILDQNTLEAFHRLRDAGLLAPRHAEVLIPATRLLHDLTQILRLCLEGPFDPATAPKGLQALLARAGDAASFPELEARLRASLASVAQMFDAIVA